MVNIAEVIADFVVIYLEKLIAVNRSAVIMLNGEADKLFLGVADKRLWVAERR